MPKRISAADGVPLRVVVAMTDRHFASDAECTRVALRLAAPRQRGVRRLDTLTHDNASAMVRTLGRLMAQARDAILPSLTPRMPLHALGFVRR